MNMNTLKQSRNGPIGQSMISLEQTLNNRAVQSTISKDGSNANNFTNSAIMMLETKTHKRAQSE